TADGAVSAMYGVAYGVDPSLASLAMSFEDSGPALDPASIVELPHSPAYREGDSVTGTIDVLDVRFGSLWSNIPYSLFSELGVGHGGPPARQVIS
ncbi:MAG: hypothetical protein ACOYM2_16050, partial [Rectinemataceae bacterium]